MSNNYEADSGGGGSGNVVGPSGATDSAVAVYDGNTGKILKNSTFGYVESDHGFVVGDGTGHSYNYIRAASGQEAFIRWTINGGDVAQIDVAGSNVFFDFPSGGTIFFRGGNVGGSTTSTLGSDGNFITTGYLSPASYVVSSLPASPSGNPFATVSDSTLPLSALGVGIAPTGGGTNVVPVFWNGSAWLSF